MSEATVGFVLAKTNVKYLKSAQRDICAALVLYPHLKMSTKDFAMAEGQTMRPTCRLKGTIPISSNTNTRKVTVSVFIPDYYPYRAPVCFVHSTTDLSFEGMIGVDETGRISLQYLDDWIFPESNLRALLKVLCSHLEELSQHSKRETTTETLRSRRKSNIWEHLIQITEGQRPGRAKLQSCPPLSSGDHLNDGTKSEGGVTVPDTIYQPGPSGSTSSNKGLSDFLAVSRKSSLSSYDYCGSRKMYSVREPKAWERKSLQEYFKTSRKSSINSSIWSDETFFGNTNDSLKSTIATVGFVLVKSKTKYFAEAQREIVDALQKYPQFKYGVKSFMIEGEKRKTKTIRLKGSFPVERKMLTHNVPVSIFLPDQFPYCAPICLVRPTKDLSFDGIDMIDKNGRMDILYLRDWIYPEHNMCGLLEMIGAHLRLCSLRPSDNDESESTIEKDACSRPTIMTNDFEQFKKPAASDAESQAPGRAEDSNTLESSPKTGESTTPMSSADSTGLLSCKKIDTEEEGRRLNIKFATAGFVLARTNAKNPIEAHKDVISLMSQYRELTPCAEYLSRLQRMRNRETFCLKGTLNRQRDDNASDIQLSIYLPQNYPYCAPICTIRSFKGLSLSLSSMMDKDDRIRLSYLEEWKYPQSNLRELMKIIVASI